MLGLAEGEMLGDTDALGLKDGLTDGLALGLLLGLILGLALGLKEADGLKLGLKLGLTLGLMLGLSLALAISFLSYLPSISNCWKGLFRTIALPKVNPVFWYNPFCTRVTSP